jgi:site-specific DNA-methyltransferase (cytosine-N4-specific)
MLDIEKIKNTIICGDAPEVLKELPDESVNCVITSPPYYGLRDYGTATWIGGDEKCDHIEIKALKRDVSGGLLGRDKGTRGEQPHTSASNLTFRKVCQKCGAIRQDQQIGLEETPETYIQKLVEVFKEVKRVLKDDGTLWLNLGDTYAGGGRGCDTPKQQSNRGTRNMPDSIIPVGLKPKDLIGIPWRVAFALQADGWYLRQDIIWAKPNPMPESVTDRCTKSHEYIFLLAKNQKYYFDNEAIKEPDHPDGRKQTIRKQTNRYNDALLNKFQDNQHERWTGKRNKRSVFLADDEYMILKKDLTFATKQHIIGEMIKRELL